MKKQYDPLKVEKTDHPDLVGGIVWTDCELRWIRAYGTRCFNHGNARGMEAGRLLWRLHDENITLQQGYDAARLEIESLRGRLAGDDFQGDGWLQDRGLLYRLTDERQPVNRDEINVTMADGSRSDEARTRRASELLRRMRGQHCLHQIAEPAGEYPALPEPATHQIAEVKSCEHGDAIIGWRVEPSRQSFNASMLPKRMLYTADQMRAYVDADRAMRTAQPASAAAAAQEPVAWKHDCAALLTNDVELWIDACPHCGKPRNAPQPVEREPLTDEMVLAALRVMSPATFKHGLHPLEKDGPMIRQRMEIETKLVRKMLDAAHGIKGGQHGTDT